MLKNHVLTYKRQFSADIKTKNHKINSIFVSLEGPKTIHDFSVWLRTGSNPAYINRSKTRIFFFFVLLIIMYISYTKRILTYPS